MYHDPGDLYDRYGWGPGPLGSRWLWMSWPTYLKQLQASGLSVTRQAEPRGAYQHACCSPLDSCFNPSANRSKTAHNCITSGLAATPPLA